MGEWQIVTGAGSGNGPGIATAFAREGAAGDGRRVSEQRGEAAVTQPPDQRRSVVRFRADVPSPLGGRRSPGAETVQRFGRLDHMVTTPEILDGYATCLDTSAELFDEVLSIICAARSSRCKRALAEMVQPATARIIIHQLGCRDGADGGGLAYTTSQHAVVG